MSFINRIIGNGHDGSKSAGDDNGNRNGNRNGNKGKRTAPTSASLADDALDTLGCLIRTMGTSSFPLEDEADPSAFPAQCNEFAAHVENGSAVPSHDIEPSADGSREWGRVRRFFIDRRKDEQAFVTERLQNYRGIVDDMVSGLREIGERDRHTEQSVRAGLGTIETAVQSGEINAIKASLADTIKSVGETFAEQKKRYEEQIRSLNERMSSLRQDLVAAHEEMKRDTLTGLFNRGAFDAAVKHSVNMHFVLHQPLTLVLVDVDRFKEVNDQFGHPSGDEVLRSVAESLERSFVRRGDLVARFGGDEFAVILNDTTSGQSAPLIQRFVERVGQIEIPYAPPGARVTCSIGYAEVAPDDSLESLITRADRALYRAKAGGRDRVEFEPAAAPEAAAQAARQGASQAAPQAASVA